MVLEIMDSYYVATAMSKANYVKIFFNLEHNGNGYPPVDVESLWAVDLKNGTYRLENVPFYATAVSLKDIVRVRQENGRLNFLEIIAPSGNSTIRVIMFDKEQTQTVRDEFTLIGCSTELSNIKSFFSVDVPLDVNYEIVLELLARYSKLGQLDFEESALRHLR